MNVPPVCAMRRFLLLGVGLALSACAGGLPNVDPVDIPRLEQEVLASPDNTGKRVQLGMAQFKAGDFLAARTSLQTAVEAGADSGPAFLYLGMTEEELQDWSAAREAYTSYLEVGASAPARAEVRKRLTLIGRNLLRAQALQALAQEQEITATGAITAQSVAVMPLAFNSERAELEPLIYALSDMMITDFKVSNALTVLERAQVQTLLDEMALNSGGYADAATGARAGRMLRAEHVFQGVLTTLGDDDLQTLADILNIPNTASAGQITETAVLEQLFDMEKQIVIRTIREVLQVQLTPAEEQRILDNRTENVLAFLAYGRGLRSLDGGDYDGATQEFALAMQLEPGGFAAAEAKAGETAALTDASTTSTATLEATASTTGETGAGIFAPPTSATTESMATLGVGDPPPVGEGSSDGDGQTFDIVSSTLINVDEGVNPNPNNSTLGQGSADQTRNATPEQTQPTNRDPVPESTGAEGVGTATAAQIRIVIRRPGGGQ